MVDTGSMDNNMLIMGNDQLKMVDNEESIYRKGNWTVIVHPIYLHSLEGQAGWPLISLSQGYFRNINKS